MNGFGRLLSGKRERFLFFFVLLFLLLFIYTRGRFPSEPQQSQNPLLSASFSTFQTTSPFTALIVSPEEHELLRITIFNLLSHLPPIWRIQVFTRPSTISALKATFYKSNPLQVHLDSGKIVLTPLSSEPEIPTGILFRTESFWDRVLGEKILVTSVAAAICSNSHYHIDDFLKWDWIGAPWKWARKDYPQFFWGGNGAFSLRSKKILQRVLRDFPPTAEDLKSNEDMWFVTHIYKMNQKLRSSSSSAPIKSGEDELVMSFAHLAPQEEAKKFSVEEMYSPHPFGVFHMMNTMEPDKRRLIISNCPDILKVHGSCVKCDSFIENRVTPSPSPSPSVGNTISGK